MGCGQSKENFEEQYVTLIVSNKLGGGDKENKDLQIPKLTLPPKHQNDSDSTLPSCGLKSHWKGYHFDCNRDTINLLKYKKGKSQKNIDEKCAHFTGRNVSPKFEPTTPINTVVKIPQDWFANDVNIFKPLLESTPFKALDYWGVNDFFSLDDDSLVWRGYLCMDPELQLFLEQSKVFKHKIGHGLIGIAAQTGKAMFWTNLDQLDDKIFPRKCLLLENPNVGAALTLPIFENEQCKQVVVLYMNKNEIDSRRSKEYFGRSHEEAVANMTLKFYATVNMAKLCRHSLEEDDDECPQL